MIKNINVRFFVLAYDIEEGSLKEVVFDTELCEESLF